MVRLRKSGFGSDLEKKQKKGGRRIPKPGTQVEYKGKKYVSLKELSKEINVPYSPLMHNIIGQEISRM